MLKIPVTKKDHIQGNINAPITLVEYADFECGYCGMAYPIINKVQRHFGKQLRFVFRHFPLTQAHPHAELAAETSEFANNKNRFWQMHDLLFENQANLSADLMLELIDLLKLPKSDYEQALQNKIYLPKIKEDFMGGVRSGVNGTPTLFINGYRYTGPVQYEELIYTLEQGSARTGTE